MKPEPLGNNQFKGLSATVKAELEGRASSKEERERARCSNGVCEVLWKPSETTRSRKTRKQDSLGRIS